MTTDLHPNDRPSIRSLQIRFRAFLLGPKTTPLEADGIFLVAGFVRFFVAFEKGKRMRTVKDAPSWGRCIWDDIWLGLLK